MSRRSITFFVPGRPASQGSWKHKGRRSVHDDETLKPWRQAVAAEAMQHWDGEPTDGPVALSLYFQEERPAYHYRGRKIGKALRDKAPMLPTKGRDGDKMERAVNDALTGVCFTNDARVCSCSWMKDWGTPGVRITVTELDE